MFTLTAMAATGSRTSSEKSAQRRWSKMPPIFSNVHKTSTAATTESRAGERIGRHQKSNRQQQGSHELHERIGIQPAWHRHIVEDDGLASDFRRQPGLRAIPRAAIPVA